MKDQNREEQVKSKYPNVDLNTCKNLDPSVNKKFIVWIARELEAGNLPQDIGPTVELFVSQHERLKKKDIYEYTAKELEDELKDIGSSNRANRKKKTIYNTKFSEMIGNHQGYKLYRILTRSAAQEKGKNTRWCITMENTNYFLSYTSDGSVFYMAIKLKEDSEDNNKLAFLVRRNEEKQNEYVSCECYNVKDVNLKTAYVNSTYKELVNAIKEDAPKFKTIYDMMDNNELSLEDYGKLFEEEIISNSY